MRKEQVPPKSLRLKTHRRPQRKDEKMKLARQKKRTSLKKKKKKKKKEKQRRLQRAVKQSTPANMPGQLCWIL